MIYAEKSKIFDGFSVLFDDGNVAVLSVPTSVETFPRGYIFRLLDGLAYRCYYSKSLAFGVRHYFCKVLKNEE